MFEEIPHTKRLVIEKFKFNRFGYGSPRSTIVFRRADYRRFPDHGQRDCRNYTHPRSIPLNSLGNPYQQRRVEAAPPIQTLDLFNPQSNRHI